MCRTRPLTMTELHFQEEQFYQICVYAQTGDLDELKKTIDSFYDEDKARFSDNTFCPDPSLHLPSPFVLAAQHGRLGILKYLLETFPGLIDVNRGATILSKTQQIKTHNVPPLVAACTNDDLELVKYLVKQGADIHKQSLTKATALRAAAYYGYIHIMEYLLELGANIDEPNCVGSSPMLAAAHNGWAEATLFLLKKGCNLNQRTIEGYTAVHEAAHRGKIDVLKVLLDFGMSPHFACRLVSKEDGEGRYVPCPLFLAASMGHKEVFDMLIDHSDCTLECKAEAYLLFATSIFEYPGVPDVSLQFWMKGLELMENLADCIPEFPQIQEYSNVKEAWLSNASYALQLWNDPQFVGREKPLQCLIIRERCMGLEDQSLLECLIKRGFAFLEAGLYKECEGLWARAMLVEETICQVESTHPKLFGYCDGIMEDLRTDMQGYVEGIEIMVLKGYSPDFNHLFNFGLNCLGYLKKLRNIGRGDSEVIDLQPILVSLLTLLYIWVSHDYNGETEAFTPTSLFVTACEHLVQFHSNDSNLLYLFLSKVLPHDAIQVLPHLADSVMAITLKTLLSCGVDKFVNETLPNGITPILCVFNSSLECSDNMIQKCLSVLIEYGAHPDGVDINGKMFYDLKSISFSAYSYLLQSIGPLNLSCIAAHTIVRENIDYLQNLPAHVVSFVKLHDSRFVQCKMSPVTKYFS